MIMWQKKLCNKKKSIVLIYKEDAKNRVRENFSNASIDS